MVGAEGPLMPEDLDQLVRQAMSLGTTAHIEKAFAAQAEVQLSEPVPDEELPSRGVLLQRLVTAAQEAARADSAGEESALATALADARSALSALPVGTVQSEPLPPSPVVMLPKVRRRFSLVVEGVGDVEVHESFVTHLRLDAVTSRMIARARQPRIALRSDEEDDLRERAKALVSESQIRAVVINSSDLTEIGPARLLTSFESGPEFIDVHDWTADLHALMERNPSTSMNQVPSLIVPGELVFQRYRAASGGGRLKHLREGKLDSGRQVRLQVVDLHLQDGIVRIFEGATDLAHAPGASEDGFHRTLAQMLEAWANQGCPVLTSRTLEPTGPEGQVDELGGVLAHPWPQWEEHSRSSRVLYLGE